MSINRRDFVKLAPAFPAAAVTGALVICETGKEDVELDVSVLKCQPGDTLVLRSERPISMESAERIEAYMEHVFQGRIKAIVLDSGLSLDGVIRA